MAARVQKHDHRPAIISHNEDWTKVLTMCQAKPCNNTIINLPTRVLISGPNELRKRYRAQTTDEFKEWADKLPHLCCG